ncbi:hypothetical protein C8J57DRAFT_1228230 [Mycena rebaudengoi]|nr:hypothetical protein C8J57DRAFT_1228230 [Mycena rebaudengoi]
MDTDFDIANARCQPRRRGEEGVHPFQGLPGPVIKCPSHKSEQAALRCGNKPARNKRTCFERLRRFDPFKDRVGEFLRKILRHARRIRIDFGWDASSMQLCFWLCNSVQLCATLWQVVQLNAITVQLNAVVVQFNATPLLFRYYSCFEMCTRLHKTAQNIIRYNCTKLHRHLHYIAQACAQSCTKLHRTAQCCTELHSAILNKAIRLKFSRFYAETGNNSSLLASTLHLLTCPFLLYTILPIPFVDAIPQLEGITRKAPYLQYGDPSPFPTHGESEPPNTVLGEGDDHAMVLITSSSAWG